MPPHQFVAFAEVGHAIHVAQSFEMVLAQLFEFFKMQEDKSYALKTGGFVAPGAYKAPLRNLLKRLQERGQVEPTFATRLDQYIEARHVLVHRWVLQNGPAVPDDVAHWEALARHAKSVTVDAEYLMDYLLRYVLKYADPAWAETHPDEYKRRMANLFSQEQAL